MMRARSLHWIAGPAWVPWVLVLLLAVGAALRLVSLTSPPLDFQSTRQLRNSLVARAIYYDALPGADPHLRSLADSFRRAVGQYEPPISESLAAWVYLLAGGESFAVPRILGTVYWVISALALFDLARRTSSPVAALLSACYYLVLPFAVQASRSFQPDPLMTAAFVVSLWALYRWSEDRTWQLAIVAAAAASLAVLVKIIIVFMVVGAAGAIVLATLGREFWRSRQVWVMALIMALPATLYYVLAHPGRSSEYFFAWTIDLVSLIASPHFYADWLGFVGRLLGLALLFAGVVGTFLVPVRARWLLLGAWLGYLIYGLMLPFQMTTHSYYHIQLVPLVALGLAPIGEAILQRIRGLGLAWRLAMLLPVFAFLGYQAWAARSVLVQEDFSDAPAFWKGVGDALPQNGDVIALTQDYGFDLMYWGWRKVDLWPLNSNLAAVRNSSRDLAGRFTELTAGDRYFLITAFGQLESQPELKAILAGYPVVAQGDGFILYDLQHSP